MESSLAGISIQQILVFLDGGRAGRICESQHGF